MERHKSRDYFAEMYVAGVMADSGWNIYFPRRDEGFSFIAMLNDDNPHMWRDYHKFFDGSGLSLIASPNWCHETVSKKRL